MVKPKTTPKEYVQPYRYPSPNIPMSAIKRFARQIAEKFHPDKIILFGSYAYGTPHNESDVDLLVIMPARNAIDQALKIALAFEEYPFCLDLMVRTPKQIEIGFRDDNWFIREIVEKGKVLYEAPNRQMGAKGGGRHRRSAIPRRTKAAVKRHGGLPLSTIR
jgi:predicted nucleotidyltransferase